MKRSRHALLVLLGSLGLVILLSGCGGGGGGGGGSRGSGSDPAADASTPEGRGFAAVTFSYSDTPRKDHEVVLGASFDGQLEKIRWSLLREPRGADGAFVPAPDLLSVSFVPTAVGEYEIGIDAVVDGETAEATTTFTVREPLPYDLSKVERDDPDVPLDETIARVTNQVFVFSQRSDESTLRRILRSYPELEVVGYDPVEGLLVEFDETSMDALDAIEDLAFESGVDSVAYRMHEGDAAPRMELVPSDGSAFNDGGDNWHLEEIGAEAAWDETTGSRRFLVGVSDSGYHGTHEDLRGRFAEILTSRKGTHGMGVAGAIAARANNRRGITGINWQSKLIAGRSGSDLFNILDKVSAGREVVVVNSSWSMTGWISEFFDPASPSHRSARLEKTIDGTRRYRNAARGRFREKLLVWSGGNGVGNGAAKTPGNVLKAYGVPSRYNNGAVHLDNDGSLAKLDNVIVVAAVTSDGRLPYYSQYGETIDLAAPTHYKSTKEVLGNGASRYYTGASYGGNQPGGFSGTSAAAPVVTGAASLVFSANPDLAAKEVKRILVETATREVTQRYTRPGAGPGNIAALAHAIPILDLEKAVDAAPPPELTIRTEPTTIVEGETVVFDSTLEHGLGPFVYQWSFGDGGTSALADDSHAYERGGVYTVRLVVVDALDREVEASLQIHIEDTRTPADTGSDGDSGDDDWVVWFTGNVDCWGAPLLYVTHRAGFEREELRRSFDGGGIDPVELVEKRELRGGFASREDAMDWICGRISGYYSHYWCGRHYVVDGDPFRLGNLTCDTSRVPEVPAS